MCDARAPRSPGPLCAGAAPTPSPLRRRGAPTRPPGVAARCAGAARRGGWWDGAAEGGHVGGPGVVAAPARQAPGADQGGESAPRAGGEQTGPAGRGGAVARSPRPTRTRGGGPVGRSAGEPRGRGRGRAPLEGLKPARPCHGEGRHPADLRASFFGSRSPGLRPGA